MSIQTHATSSVDDGISGKLGILKIKTVWNDVRRELI